jgi:hypothetical protein
MLITDDELIALFNLNDAVPFGKMNGLTLDM